MKRLALLLITVASLATPIAGRATPCVETPRLDSSNPVLAAQRASFGFHDEELVLCSPGFTEPTHLAARLWVPEGCVGGGCPAVLVAHGFGFSKEATFADMYNAVGRGLVVLGYDVRGQGASGGQSTFLDRDDIADQAAVLAWMQRELHPSKVAVYGISQGGWLAMVAATYNCGAARSASFDLTVPCDDGGRWVDAVVPMQGPASFEGDGTCSAFGIQAIPMSRGAAKLIDASARCVAGDDSPQGSLILDLRPALDSIDVPMYFVTSFMDRLVLPQGVVAAYEHMRARADDSTDPYSADVRLLISNDGHGEVGGNFAVLDDVFGWIARTLTGGSPWRDAPVAIAQEWDSNRFRLESAWPILGTMGQTLYLSRATADATANGSLAGAVPASESPEQLFNVPSASSPPGLPFAGALPQVQDPYGTPGTRLVYVTEPLASTTEVTGLPEARVWVSSSNTAGEGAGQIHVALAEVDPSGRVVEFARGRRGARGLGAVAREVVVPLTVSDHRIDAGNRLMLSITPANAGEALPAETADSLFVHHDAQAPSSIRFETAPIDRAPPPGNPPSGAAFAEDPTGSICSALRIPC